MAFIFFLSNSSGRDGIVSHKSEHLCLVPDFRGKAVIIFLLFTIEYDISMILTWAWHSSVSCSVMSGSLPSHGL